jgi:hypothetical protein
MAAVRSFITSIPGLEVAMGAPNSADVRREPAVDRVDPSGDVGHLVGVGDAEQRLQDAAEQAAVVLTFPTFTKRYIYFEH